MDDYQDEGFGALGGMGADAVDRVTTGIDPKTGALTSRTACGRCNTPNVIHVDWGEAITVGEGYIPPRWKGDRETGTIYPYIACANANCRYEIKVGYYPHEMKGYVSNALGRRIIQPQQVQQVIAALRGGAG